MTNDKDEYMDAILGNLMHLKVFNLHQLNLSDTAPWFADEDGFERIIDFISKQKNLQIIYVNNCKLKGEKLIKLINTINDLENNCLKKFYFNGVTFCPDSCEAFA